MPSWRVSLPDLQRALGREEGEVIEKGRGGQTQPRKKKKSNCFGGPEVTRVDGGGDEP